MIYLGPWQKDIDNGWNGPEGTLHALDLRPISQTKIPPGAPTGKGIFYVPTDGSAPVPDPTVYDVLGASWDARLSTAARSWLRLGNGLPISGSTLLEALWELYTSNSDLEGENGLRPLMPSNNDLAITFAGLKNQRPMSPVDYERVRQVREMEAAEYADLEAQGKLPVGTAEKALGYLCIKQGIPLKDWKLLIKDPSRQLKFTRASPPESSITDDFNRADETPIASPWSLMFGVAGDWDLDLNQAKKVGPTGGGDSGIKHSTSLSGSDQNSQVYVPTTGLWIGPAARVSGSTCYGCNVAGTVRIAKYITGTRTQLSAHGSSSTGTWKLEVSGSTLSIYLNGSYVGGTTDSSITTGLQGGIVGLTVNGYGDDFYIEDIGSSTNQTKQSIFRGVSRGAFRGSR